MNKYVTKVNSRVQVILMENENLSEIVFCGLATENPVCHNPLCGVTVTKKCRIRASNVRILEY